MCFNVLMAGILAAGAMPVKAETLDGKVYDGVVLSISADQVTLKTEDAEPTRLPTNNVAALEVRPQPDVSQGPYLLLVDKTKVHYDSLTVTGQTAQATRGKEEPIQIPLRTIRHVLTKPLDDAVRNKWDAIAEAQSSGDLIVVRKKKVDGTPYLDYLEGAVIQVSTESVAFEFDGSEVDVPLAKLQGLMYYQANTRVTGTGICVIRDIFGNVWPAAKVTMGENEVAIRTPAGVEHSLTWEQITKFDFAAANTIFLTDLEASAIRWSQFLELPSVTESETTFYRPRQIDAESGPVIVAGQAFRQGLTIDGPTILDYQVPEGVKRFVAVAGIDAQSEGLGKVKLRILGDGKSLISRDIGAEDTVTLNVPLAGVKRLRIIVETGLIVGAKLNLVNTRLIK